MEWKYNDKSKKKMTINKKGNVSIDEIMIVVVYVLSTTKQTYLVLHHHSHHAS